MAINMAMFMSIKETTFMIQANIADFKNHLSEYIEKVQSGQVVEICKRNVPIAIVSPCDRHHTNGTVPGCGVNTVKIHGDLTEPVLESDWEMLGGDHERSA